MTHAPAARSGADRDAAVEALRAVLCAHPEVKLAYLFGSRVTGNTGPLSDYDVAVLLDEAALRYDEAFALAHELRMAVDAEVDLVTLNRAAITLAYVVISQGRLLTQRDVATRVDYEAYVLNLYCDYLPVLRQQRRDLLHGDCDAARVRRHRDTTRRVEDTLAALRAPANKGPG